MGISAGGAALIAAGVTAAAGAGTAAYTIHAQDKAAEEAQAAMKANQQSATAAQQAAQSSQQVLNAQSSVNQQAGAFLTNPAVKNAPGAQSKSLLG